MFRQAATARREIAYNMAAIGITPDPETRRNVRLAVDRDLQAQRLRPNVPVPPRRAVLSYLKTMRAETGSWLRAIQSLLHSGSWTSSGGSFRLADKMNRNLYDLCERTLSRKSSLTFLEIGAGWAGFGGAQDAAPTGIAALAQRYGNRLGYDLNLHFTNLTRWHNRKNLPGCVTEHPHVTAASLAVLEQHGLQLGSVDVIYSQAAAYFEPDQARFVAAAAGFLAPGGTMIYNHQEKDAEIVRQTAAEHGLQFEHRLSLGGMNGDVVLLRKSAQADSAFEAEAQPWLTAAE